MSTSNKRVIEISDRPWAARRLYQRFLGSYLLHRQTGLYFSVDSTPEQNKLLVNTFLRLPQQYQDVAREYALTLSFCRYATANGNSSTFYADFNHYDRKKISPHVEMSEASLAPALVLPHLTHEVSHLWWRNLKEEKRESYRRWLVEQCSKDTIEVTGYAQDYFEHYLEECDCKGVSAAVRRQNSLKSWAEESFCESVAVLHAPGYPNFSEDTTIDLKARRRTIEQITGLHLPKLSRTVGNS